MSGTYVFLFKQNLASAWQSANPILAAGEPGIETDTGKIKFGDGVRSWNNIPYSTDWSRYAPTQDVDMGAKRLTNVSGITGLGGVTGALSAVSIGGTNYLTLDGKVINIVGPTGPQGVTGTYSANGVGFEVHGNNSFAGGVRSGRVNQQDNALALGVQAGEYSQGGKSIAIGFNAAQENQLSESIAIGNIAGRVNQSNFSIALGSNAGTVNQSNFAVALGFNSGNATQGPSSIAIGDSAGASNQGTTSIAVGWLAGQSGQRTSCVAIGSEAGNKGQNNGAVAIGYQAAIINQAGDSVAIGNQAGKTNQSSSSIAVGLLAGRDRQGEKAVAIGSQAGEVTQRPLAVAIGEVAGLTNQGSRSVAIGCQAGNTNQGDYSIAIGNETARETQGIDSVAIGRESGRVNQGNNTVAIGFLAGRENQGNNSIAIGSQAGLSNLPPHSIVLNGTGLPFNAGISSAFYVKPIRVDGTQATGLNYNPTTGEIVQAGILPPRQIYSTAHLRIGDSFTFPSNDDYIATFFIIGKGGRRGTINPAWTQVRSGTAGGVSIHPDVIIPGGSVMKAIQAFDNSTSFVLNGITGSNLSFSIKYYAFPGQESSGQSDPIMYYSDYLSINKGTTGPSYNSTFINGGPSPFIYDNNRLISEFIPSIVGRVNVDTGRDTYVPYPNNATEKQARVTFTSPYINNDVYNLGAGAGYQNGYGTAARDGNPGGLIILYRSFFS